MLSLLFIALISQAGVIVERHQSSDNTLHLKARHAIGDIKSDGSSQLTPKISWQTHPVFNIACEKLFDEASELLLGKDYANVRKLVFMLNMSCRNDANNNATLEVWLYLESPSRAGDGDFYHLVHRIETNPFFDTEIYFQELNRIFSHLHLSGIKGDVFDGNTIFRVSRPRLYKSAIAYDNDLSDIIQGMYSANLTDFHQFIRKFINDKPSADHIIQNSLADVEAVTFEPETHYLLDDDRVYAPGFSWIFLRDCKTEKCS